MGQDVSEQDEKAISQDAKNLAVVNWIATIFFGFIPGLVFYLVKKDDSFLQDQAKEALNWAITVALAYVAAFVLSAIVIGSLLMPLIGLCHIAFCVLGAVAVSKGDRYRTPFAIRLIH
jgi:hypothetical protein